MRSWEHRRRRSRRDERSEGRPGRVGRTLGFGRRRLLADWGEELFENQRVDNRYLRGTHVEVGEDVLDLGFGLGDELRLVLHQGLSDSSETVLSRELRTYSEALLALRAA